MGTNKLRYAGWQRSPRWRSLAMACDRADSRLCLLNHAGARRNRWRIARIGCRRSAGYPKQHPGCNGHHCHATPGNPHAAGHRHTNSQSNVRASRADQSTDANPLAAITRSQYGSGPANGNANDPSARKSGRTGCIRFQCTPTFAGHFDNITRCPRWNIHDGHDGG